MKLRNVNKGDLLLDLLKYSEDAFWLNKEREELVSLISVIRCGYVYYIERAENICKRHEDLRGVLNSAIETFRKDVHFPKFTDGRYELQWLIGEIRGGDHGWVERAKELGETYKDLKADLEEALVVCDQLIMEDFDILDDLPLGDSCYDDDLERGLACGKSETF